MHQEKAPNIVASPHKSKAFANEPPAPVFHKLAATFTAVPPLASLSATQAKVASGSACMIFSASSCFSLTAAVSSSFVPFVAAGREGWLKGKSPV
jgi:hypothetical protein